jgi:fructose-bisphosphate aldolase, class II
LQTDLSSYYLTVL